MVRLPPSPPRGFGEPRKPDTTYWLTVRLKPDTTYQSKVRLKPDATS
jgi:hypothetical protein